MIYKVGYIRDVLGNNYLGLKFVENQLTPFLSDLYEIIDNDDTYDTFTSNQQNRDKRDNQYDFHSTVISVMDYNKLSKQMGGEFQKRVDIIQSLDITDLTFKGVGTAERSDNQSYFVVLDSPTLDEIRSSVGLPKIDFHITLGFDRKDVFGVRKNEVIKKKSRLSKIVDKQYSIHDGSHIWLKDIENFDDNLKQIPEDKIEILKMTDTIITYRLGHTQIQIGLINDDKDLYVMTMCEYEDK
tara:strand:- start:116025 stop:116747 length:723 start_codon:yes stop_codon:yes gene_type:complete